MGKINLGDRVQDTISGFTGIVTGQAQYLHGCDTCSVKSEELKDGKPITSQWFDRPQLKLLKAKSAKASRKRVGGPKPTPHRRDNPRKGNE